jgi:hypothetical protein
MSSINYASELRIGNIVSFPVEKSGENSYYENSVIVKLSHLYASAFILNGDSKKYYEAPIRKIIPIALNDDILLRCGFTNCSFGHYHFTLANGFSKLSVFGFKRIELCNDLGTKWGHVDCTYLHQLQNLIFALKGEELQLGGL